MLKSHHGLKAGEPFFVSFSLLYVLFSSLLSFFRLSSCLLLTKEKEEKGRGRTWNVTIGHFIKPVLYSWCHSSASSYPADSWRMMKYAVVKLFEV